MFDVLDVSMGVFFHDQDPHLILSKTFKSEFNIVILFELLWWLDPIRTVLIIDKFQIRLIKINLVLHVS
jgi:hypothetical protein